MLWGSSSCSFLVLSIPCMNPSSQPVRVFFYIVREGLDVYSQLLQLVGTELLAHPGSEDVLVPVVELYYHLADADDHQPYIQLFGELEYLVGRIVPKHHVRLGDPPPGLLYLPRLFVEQLLSLLRGLLVARTQLIIARWRGYVLPDVNDVHLGAGLLRQLHRPQSGI